MYAQVEKSKENKSQSVSNVVSQKQSDAESTFQKKTSNSVIQNKVIQRLDYNQLSNTQEAQVDAVADGIYYQYAPEFEDAVGAASFIHNDATTAARNTADNFSTILSAYASTRMNNHGESDQEKQNRYLEDYLGSGDREPAGSINQDANQIRGALGGGNLREQLTLMYNSVMDGRFGRIVHGVLTNTQVQNQLIHNVGQVTAQGMYNHLNSTAVHFNINNAVAAQDRDFIPRADNAITDTRGVEENQTRDLPPRYRPNGTDIHGNRMMVEIDYNTFQPIHGTRVIMPDNPGGQTQDAVDSRVERPDVDKQTEDSARGLEIKGAPLSVRELIHQYLSRDPATRNQQLADELAATNNAPNNNIAQAAIFWNAGENFQRNFLMQRFGGSVLGWEPGKKVFDLVPDARFTEQMDHAKVLIKATASSSTDLIMKMGRYMYGDSGAHMLGMRAASLGWMLPVGDHSYWEIVFAASRHGTPVPQNGPAVYDEHAPMTQGQVGQDSPNLLMQNEFKDSLSHVLFRNDDNQRVQGLGVELNNIFPRSNLSIRNKITAVEGNFNATRTDNEIDRIVNAVRAPRAIVEGITDSVALQNLWDFINDDRIQNYADMDDVRNGSGTYLTVRNAIGGDNTDLLFASIFEQDGTNVNDETKYLDDVSRLLSGNQINTPGNGLGFTNDELDDAYWIARELNEDYGDQDRGKHINYHDITNNLEYEQILALREYTGNASDDWNALTSNPRSRLADVGTDNLDDNIEDLEAGVSGLQNLPVYNQGRVYRGEGGGINKYRIGDLVNFQKFLSTAKSYEDSFSPGSNITIVIDNILTGKDIQLLSKQDQEREVLFPPYARFVVTRVEDKRNSGGDYNSIWVYMNEI
ncbi:hypothetical protein D172_015660 [Pseudoalteromonas sp. Bsw20308]|uniref:ADP-ribosyltransferase domain-containing protein n=1 Tax=Pseudoalteromonas sp. Bsw20308 TaxID=283699 RepID=UPI0002AAD446|nr:ADP-ribosyltransferase domain-containing protein [Pseudoalteromonas sp. Bsw20308]ALQ09371.1 hypothetical protein D172_015660 [Pseudoalteromonas sp. Bsw20308]